MIKIKRHNIRTRAIFINIAVTLLIVLLFVLLMLFRQNQLQQSHDSLRQEAFRSVQQGVLSIQTTLSNQVELLLHNEDLQNRLIQAEMEQNSNPLPLSKTVLNHMDIDGLLVSSADYVVVSRFGTAVELFPAPLGSRVFNGLMHTPHGLLIMSRQQVLYNREVLGYVLAGKLLSWNDLVEMTGHKHLFSRVDDQARADPHASDVVHVALGQDSVSKQQEVLHLRMHGEAEQYALYRDYAGILFSLLLVIGAWWYLYKRLIGDILLRLSATSEQLGLIQEGVLFPEQTTVVDGIDEIRQALHQMSLRLRTKADILQAERQTLRAVTDAAPIWIWMIDQSGRIRFINRSMRSALGADADNALLQDLFMQPGGTVCDPMQENCDCIVRVNAGEQLFDMHLITVGQQDGLIGLAIDMTDYLALENSLRQAQKMEALGTLVGGVAHNFNNMLAAIAGRLYLAERRARNSPEVLAELSHIQASVTGASEMVKQLMAFVHKDIARKEQLCFSRLIQESVEMARMGMPEDVFLEVDICTDECLILGDASALQQVCINLMVNARDALTGRDKKIHVRLSQCKVSHAMREAYKPDADRVVCLSVQDNGSGIDAEQLERIYEPFFTTKDVGKGTGLGLSMTKGTVESHGGWIEVDSVQGKGTQFDIYLPLQACQQPFSSPVQGVPVMHGEGEWILFVDDEIQLRDVGEAMLLEMGYQVLLAENGKQALDIVRNSAVPVSLIVTDVVMPVMGGSEFYMELKPLDLSIPVLFVSGYDEGRLDLPLSDDYQVVQKPYQLDKFSRTIRTMIDADGCN